MRWVFTLTFLFLLNVPAHAGLVSYEGDFTGLFPEGSDLHSLSGSWTISVDDSPVVSGVNGLATRSGYVTSVSYEIKAPSPAGPIRVPYPDTDGPVVVNCELTPDSCVLDPDAPDCDSLPDGCVLQSVTLIYSFGVLDGLIFGGTGPLVFDDTTVEFGFQALYQTDRSISTLVYAIGDNGDDVSSPIFALSLSGSFRDFSTVPEPSTFVLIGFGLLGAGYLRRGRKFS